MFTLGIQLVFNWHINVLFAILLLGLAATGGHHSKLEDMLEGWTLADQDFGFSWHLCLDKMLALS